MKKQNSRLVFPSNLVLIVGTVSLTSLILVQAFSSHSFANASSRDEFPGRRQGGGTHWVAPSPLSVE